MRKSRIAAGLAALAIAGSGAGMAATMAAPAASAAVTTATVQHMPAPHPWMLRNNTIQLSFGGGTYQYPIYVHEAGNGIVSGYLYDKNVPAGQSPWLPISGLVSGKNIVLVVNYPAADGTQGARSFDLVVTPATPFAHVGTASGVYDETGTEAGTGAASLLSPLFR